MDWKKTAISDLKTYHERKQSLVNLHERIQMLNESMDGIGSARADKVAVKGGAPKYEDRIINSIVELDRYRRNYNAAAVLIKSIERGLNYLTEDEYKVLDEFYMRRHQHYLEDLCEELGLEKSQIYRIKDQALYRFTVSMYGLIDY